MDWQMNLFGGPATRVREETGLEIRDRVAARTLERVIGTAWYDRASACIEKWIAAGFSFSSDDLQAACGQAPNVNAVGAIFIDFANKGKIEHCGEKKSLRVEARGRTIHIWRGKA